ncbi:MAG: hypothetical protein JJU41_08895 [Bacteroidetes bacterium]|nr:hypothetical protein [Bacteroidota bacterium]MCH8524436.1 hypothetical protein [Balneolales bacterium]
MKLYRFPLMFMLMLVLFTASVQAQTLPTFAAPEIRMVPNAEKAAFERRFADITMTGAGFQGGTVIDQLPTSEIRSRLQAVFGNPTVTLDDFISAASIRPANSIQFEYWFVVNDSIPMIILDIDGPFTRGLVYAGSIEYIDMMPEIKRTLSRKLMGINRPGEFTDVFYSPERRQWFRVSYANGEYATEEIARPARFNRINLN